MVELCNALNARLKEAGFAEAFLIETREFEGKTEEVCALRHPLDRTLRIAAGRWENDIILFYFDYHEHFDLSAEKLEDKLFERVAGILRDKVITFVKWSPRTDKAVIEGAFIDNGDNTIKVLPYVAYKKPLFPPNIKRIIRGKNTTLFCWSMRRVELSKKEKKLVFTDLT